MAGIGRISSVLVLLICVLLLLATMANGIRPGVGAASAPAPAATETTVPPPPPSTPPVAAAATTAPSEQASAVDDPYKDSKRKVPNGSDPIHNRRARWGDAPAKRV